MPVRHSWPSGPTKRSARLRTAEAASACIGIPPARANRPMTGTRPGASIADLESSVAAPVLSNQPPTHKPLA